ncbi:N-terminal nucleophile aminohydrolases (Ntn hydrolases) protein [Dioscorea alata]|uniref:N-terminal nucleophile aminohydrolases (Ntn hydrolases) protein n=2 Tax=Dioscorea alata TaxID=55571 RepID=A0ACB7U3E7_DIOAL|nr:N-terminal nucleophile aminohydrolases (Ntn hydrolases) protein [Dioscorea alata]KAH7654835.1 N-terminal nucleophile aminohydrolases (Ntn hydrolases) protein [Dioscorea alata]
MLGVFSGEVVEAPGELLAAGSRTPSPKTPASELIHRFVHNSNSTISLQLTSLAHLSYCSSHHSPLRPIRLAVKDEIYCLFSGMLDNMGSLKQYYGLCKMANEAVLVLEAYKALRDRAPYPLTSMLAHLSGTFSFLVFDTTTSTLLVASDPDGKVPLFWGITADGWVAFSDDLGLLKASCGKSLAPFPPGCYYSNVLGGLKSYENPKNKITAIPANEEEVCGATFKVEGSVVAASH